MKKFQHNIIFPLLFLLFAGFLNGQTYTFTNAGAEGREGPTQAQIDANYSGTNLAGNVTINTRGIQEWVVPAAGLYSITSLGANGGSTNGGKGASIFGKFQFTKDKQLKILIGQKGTTTGGGGGSFVSDQLNNPIIIAGGGGAGMSGYWALSNGSISQDGNSGSKSSIAIDNGGTNGGAGGGNNCNNPPSGGAGGFSHNAVELAGGKSFINGGEGGLSIPSGREGGFGGGGADRGGGGGYSGGGSGGCGSGIRVGGGGGSYNSGTDQNNTAGTNEGHGKVIITFLGAANEPPVISQGTGPISKVTSEDTLTTFSTNELNATDSDSNASQLAWSLLSSPSNGTAVVDGNGSSPQVFTYQPNANYHGADSFSVQVSDGDVNDSISINLTVNPVDDPAVISGDTSGFLLEDSSLTGDLNATDIDGLTDGTYFSISSSPSSGSLSINPESGRWTYYPNSNTFGSETFTVTVTDDQNFTATQVINLNVISVNDLTSLTGDFNGTTNEDNSISGDINATDIDGLNDGSYFSISLIPSNGIATIDPVDGNWSYSPSANFYGSDSFTVTITDDQGYTASQIINLAVNPVDDPTIISGDTTASLTEDSFVSGDLNASDNDGLSDGSYFSINSNPTNGTASIDPATGAWSYSPSANFYGSDTFTVIITDDQGYSTSQIISLTVTPIDDQTIVSGEFSGKLYLDHNVSGDIHASDIDGLTDGAYFSISTNPANGTAQIDPVSGQWNYSPNQGFLGDDSFTIQITDDQGYTTNQSITINPQYNVVVAKTGQPTILDNGNALFSASIIYDGGLPVLEAGFLVSSSPAFTQSTRLPASLEQNSSAFSYEYNLSELASPLYVRAFARNQNGETVSDIKRLNPPPIVRQWSSHATTLDTGWMQSDWFGTFHLYPKNWVYHSRLGWLYIPDTDEQGIWIWSPEHNWLWTEKDVYPHLYKNSTGAWIYLLNQKTQGKNIYDYQSGLFK